MPNKYTPNLVIDNPNELLKTLGNSTAQQFVIPVKLNDDQLDDFIVVYWSSPNFDLQGTNLTTPTPDMLVAQVSQSDGSYKSSNLSVFGSETASLGGASRKFARGDINGDGVDDFAFAMNWEDGRSAINWETNFARPALLLSKPGYKYEIQILGEREWGHSVELVNNSQGTKDIIFSGYTLGKSQIYRFEGGTFVNVASEYPDSSITGNMKWANAVRAVQDPLSKIQAEYIVGSAADWDRTTPYYSVLREGLEVYKRTDDGWIIFDSEWINIDFTTPYIGWQKTPGTISVFSYSGNQYFLGSIQELTVIANQLDLNKTIVVARVAASQHKYIDTLIEGQTYEEGDSEPITIYLFYELTDTGLVLLDNPSIPGANRTNVNFFDYKDINNDSYNDLVSYAFTEPWRSDGVSAGGKPLIYLGNAADQLIQVDLSTFPSHSLSSNFGPSLQSQLHDVNNDGYVDLILFGTGGAENIEIYYLNIDISAGSEILIGTQANDFFNGNTGNDDLDGSSGLDTVFYSGNSADYNITLDIRTRISDINIERDGIDSLINIERLQFADINIALDISGTAGQAYRIYEAVLGRAPDLKGLGYWINDMDNGISLTTIAQGFIASKEFQDKYGANPPYETYVNLLYQNILGRAPDAEGLDYWLSNMRSGTNSPAVVLASFSEGYENKANVLPDIANGIYYTAWIT